MMQPEQAKQPDNPQDPKKSERDYFRSWYRKNRDRLRAQRRARYRSDPLYRELIRQRALALHRRNSALRKQKAASQPPVPRRKRGATQPRVVLMGGKIVTVHSVKELTDRINRDVQTVTGWERDKIIPPPTHRDEDRRRWFSTPYIEALAEAVRRFEAEDAYHRKRLKELVKECFEKVEAYDEQVPFE